MQYILTAQGLINCSASQSNYKTIAAALLFSDSCAPKADVIRRVMLIFFKNKFQAFNAFQCVWSFIQSIFQPSIFQGILLHGSVFRASLLYF